MYDHTLFSILANHQIKHNATRNATRNDCRLPPSLPHRFVEASQWEGMGDVGSARYEPALLPPCPTIRVLTYSLYHPEDLDCLDCLIVL